MSAEQMRDQLNTMTEERNRLARQLADIHDDRMSLAGEVKEAQRQAAYYSNERDAESVRADDAERERDAAVARLDALRADIETALRSDPPTDADMDCDPWSYWLGGWETAKERFRSVVARHAAPESGEQA